MPTTAVANELMTRRAGLGIDHHDFAIVYEVLAALAGMPKAVA